MKVAPVGPGLPSTLLTLRLCSASLPSALLRDAERSRSVSNAEGRDAERSRSVAPPNPTQAAPLQSVPRLFSLRIGSLPDSHFVSRLRALVPALHLQKYPPDEAHNSDCAERKGKKGRQGQRFTEVEARGAPGQGRESDYQEEERKANPQTAALPRGSSAARPLEQGFSAPAFNSALQAIELEEGKRSENQARRRRHRHRYNPVALADHPPLSVLSPHFRFSSFHFPTLRAGRSRERTCEGKAFSRGRTGPVRGRCPSRDRGQTAYHRNRNCE